MKKPDGLTTTSLEGKRVGIFPARPPSNGYWAVRRRMVQWVMILLYVAIPWISIKGHPALLLDVANRRFSILGNLFFAHEVPYLIFVVIVFLMGIALFTTLFGRVWCGWACPQTVFIERIFRRIERWIEGDHLAQKKRSLAPLTAGTLFRRIFKYFVFGLISLLLGQVFLGYFVGPSEAFSYLFRSPAEHPGAFFTVILISAIVLFDFGWFKEQFCLVACPYGRFQSVMMDQGSLFLAYNEKRKDCIDCGKCVAVCPTGIDVRNGLQFECIACTACADACDLVMDRIKKPRHLIGYGSIWSLEGVRTRWFRGRTVVYGLLLIGSLTILSIRISSRQVHQMEVLRAVDTPYQLVRDEHGMDYVINHFKINFYNLDWDPAQVVFALPESMLDQGVELIKSPTLQSEVIVEQGKSVASQFFLKVPKHFFKEGSAKALVSGFWNHGQKVQALEVNLVGPWK